MACECSWRAIGEHKDVKDTLRGMAAGVDKCKCSDEMFLHVFYICVYVYVYSYAYVCMCVCMCGCICVNLYIHV